MLYRCLLRVLLLLPLGMLVACVNCNQLYSGAVSTQAAYNQDQEPAPQQAERPPTSVGFDNFQRLNASLPASLHELEQQLGGGVLVAPEYGLILWGKNDREPQRIASMTKMMTLLVAFEQVAHYQGVSLDSQVTISRAAEAVNERQIYLKAGDVHPLRKLMQVALVHSANDAAYAVAEALSPGGDIQRFVAMMNVRARTLGMHTARFYNVHGLPAKHDNVASPLEVALLANEVRKIPEIREWAKIRTATFVHNNGKKNTITNTNHDLLNSCPGVTGLKTGYTDRAGSCVAATCERHGELLIAVVTGFHRTGSIAGKTKRLHFVSGLFDWGYAVLAQLKQ